MYQRGRRQPNPISPFGKLRWRKTHAWPANRFPECNLRVCEKVHCVASPRHRHIKLRLVYLRKGLYWRRGNYLINGSALARVACDCNSLIDMEKIRLDCVTAFKRDLSVLNCAHPVKLVIVKPCAGATKVLRDPDLIANRNSQLYGFVHVEFLSVLQWQKLLLAARSIVTLPTASRARTFHCSPLRKRFAFFPATATPLTIR